MPCNEPTDASLQYQLHFGSKISSFAQLQEYNGRLYVYMKYIYVGEKQVWAVPFLGFQ